MGFNFEGPRQSSEEEKMERQRLISDAEFLKGGAEMREKEKIEATDEQIEEARKQMVEDLKAEQSARFREKLWEARRKIADGVAISQEEAALLRAEEIFSGSKEEEKIRKEKIRKNIFNSSQEVDVFDIELAPVEYFKPGGLLYRRAKESFHRNFKEAWHKYAVQELQAGRTAQEILKLENAKGRPVPDYKDSQFILTPEYFSSNDMARLAWEGVIEAEIQKRRKKKEGQGDWLSSENVEKAFKSGKSIEVRVWRKSSGAFEEGWKVVNINNKTGLARVWKFGDGDNAKSFAKNVPVELLRKWNDDKYKPSI